MAPTASGTYKRRWNPSPTATVLLETIFAADSFPSVSVRNQIAVQLDIPARQIQIWYQNRRQRAKREATERTAVVEAAVPPIAAASSSASSDAPGPRALVAQPDAQACIGNLLDTASGSRALQTAARTLLLNNPLLRHPGEPRFTPSYDGI